MLLATLTVLFTGVGAAHAQATVAIVTDPDGVNLRGGPGTQFVSLTVAPRGSELPILGAKVNGTWIPVTFQGKLGFVSDEFVEIRASPAPAAAAFVPAPSLAAAPSPTPTASQVMRVTSPEGVNLRAGPGMDQRVLTVIPNNTRVTVASRSSDGRWSAVSFNGQSGWVDGQYLSAIDERAAPEATPAPSRFMWPVAGRSITTYFGGGHAGIDIDQYPSGGNPVGAVAAGRVIFAGGNPCCSYGYYVKVDHGNGYVSLYAHMAGVDVREGQEIAQGTQVGRSGSTGLSTGAHVHLEIYQNGSLVDPLSLLGR